MRSTMSFLGVLTILAIVLQPLGQAQNTMSAGTHQSAGQTPEFGYYVPVLVSDGEVSPAGYSMHLSDQEEEPVLPVLSSDYGCSVSCDCSACDSRSRRGCARNCSCLRCRHDRVFSNSFASLELLHWYNKGISLPPLVTSNSGAIPPQGDAGVFGLPTTRVLFGNSEIDDSRQTGGRLTFGWWMDDCCNVALGAKFYGVEGGEVIFNATSTGNPVLGRPFFNSDPAENSEDALLVAYPGVSTGSISLRAENDVLGAEVFGRSLLDMGDDYRVDLIGGYQFARIDSDLSISSVHSTGVATFAFSDLFDVQNQFHGFAAGVYGERYDDCFTLSALGKIAIGNMRQTANIQGSNTITAGGSVTTNGGFYAQPTNIGVYENDELVWSPEANLKLSCAITRRLSMSVGYTFLYFTRVAFAGDQIDRNVNETLLNGGALVGPARPAFDFQDHGFWIQAIDLGVSYNY